MNTKNETYKGENTMKNILIINNFLIFDYAEIDVKKFTVFIGPQASGKSIAAKLLYFFYHFPEFVFEVALAEGKKRELLKLLKENFYEIQDAHILFHLLRYSHFICSFSFILLLPFHGNR